MSTSAAEPWTVARLLDWTRKHFAERGLDAPRLCAELLLANAMGCERIRLYTRFGETPGEDVLRMFREHVRQAAAGKPIAYLIGHKEFFSLPFVVTPDVLIPRPETEILVERTIAQLRDAVGPRRILDLGTGSGCIAIALARHLPQATICASDVSAAAVTVALQNAERLGVADRIDIRTGDLFAPWCAAGQEPFDVIVSNPPYVATVGAPVEPSVRAHEPRLALFAGDDGLDIIRRILNEGPPRLRPGGHLLVEIAYDQAGPVRSLVENRGWQTLATYRDGAGHERVVHLRRANGNQVQVA